MPTFPMSDYQKAESIGADLANSRGTTVSASSSTNTKGSWTQLVAATGIKANGLLLTFSDITAAQEALVDIGVGGSGSEVVIAANLAVVGTPVGSISPGMQFLLPVNIPRGTRIAARSQSTISSASVRISSVLFGTGFGQAEALSTVDTYGANTADSGGTSIDPGASTHTKGSYVQLTGSTNRPHKYIAIAVGNQANSTRSSFVWLLDIAIGGAGSEQVIIPNLALNCSSTSDIILPQCFNMLPVNIPRGSRIAARAQCSGNDATDRLFDLIVYGMG